jgi:AraC-like DNA-binding protein
MSATLQHLPSNYHAHFTGDGIDFAATTQTGVDIRPIPLSAGVLPKGQPWDYHHVFSPFCRLYFARHAHLYINSEGARHRVPRNGFLLIPAEFNFHCASDASTEHLWIHFNLQPAWLDGFKQPIAMVGDPTSRALANRLWECLNRPDFPDAGIHKVKALLHALFSELNLSAKSSVPPQLHKAMELINAHLHHGLTVQELARKAGYSPEHLAHLFRKHLQTSPSACIRSARIHEAARRLAYTPDTIDAIADDLGFANRHHFSRTFKATLNQSPAAFRHHHQQPKRPAMQIQT